MIRLRWDERELELDCGADPDRALRTGVRTLRAAFAAGCTRVVADADGAADERVLALLGFRDGVCEQPGMSVDDVREVLDALAGLRLWLDGGWGVDALLGAQTRPHRDLDLAVDVRDLPEAERRLAQLDYEEVEEGWVGRPTRVVFVDRRGRWLDLHPLEFDDAGDGRQRLPDGGAGLYPGSELVEGSLAGRRVPCISAALQLRHHSGYTPAEHDLADLERLREIVAAG